MISFQPSVISLLALACVVIHCIRRCAVALVVRLVPVLVEWVLVSSLGKSLFIIICTYSIPTLQHIFIKTILKLFNHSLHQYLYLIHFSLNSTEINFTGL